MTRLLLAVSFLALCACAPKDEASPPAAEIAPEVAAPDEATRDASLPTLTKPADADDVTVTSPNVGARLTSPVVIEGTAINTFFFEGVFQAELIANGKVIARGPAQQAGDRNWTDPGQVGFKATLPFEVTTETNAEIVLSEDMPATESEDSDVAGPARAVKIPVVLAPTS
jgi:hypothetical protein